MDILQAAINNYEIKPYLQPIVDLTGEKTGFEVLSRWIKPNGEMIMPSSFIEEFKNDSTLLLAWNDSIIDQLINYFKNKEYQSFDLHINIYSCTLNIKTIEKIINLNQYINIVIEILEDDNIHDEVAFLYNMKMLHNHNIKFAIDDFGSGLNDKNRLNKYQFDVIKIDREIISHVEDCHFNKNIIIQILHIAKNLKIKVIAEGVETIKQVNALKKMGINLFQGFYFYKPLPLDKIHL